MNTQVLDQALAQAVEAGATHGAIGVVVNAQGLIYSGASGRSASDAEAPAMHADALLALFSMSKLATGMAAMQCVERGELTLADEAARFAPEIAALEVLTGFDEAGQPQTRPPRRAITVGDLALHVSGLGYEFFNPEDARFRKARKVPTVASNKPAAFASVLLHDPGERFTYGTGVDWLGRVLEGASGQRLGALMSERLFTPLCMASTGFATTEAAQTQRVPMVARGPDGAPMELPPNPPGEPPMDCGGQGLVSTLPDYAKLIACILANGQAASGAQVLAPAGIDALCTDGLAALGLSSCGWASCNVFLATSGELLPGVPKGWSLAGEVNRERAPSGRSAGSIGWAGLGNLYYWIDRKHKLGGIWATQRFPFADPPLLAAAAGFEAAAYSAMGFRAGD